MAFFYKFSVNFPLWFAPWSQAPTIAEHAKWDWNQRAEKEGKIETFSLRVRVRELIFGDHVCGSGAHATFTLHSNPARNTEPENVEKAGKKLDKCSNSVQNFDVEKFANYICYTSAKSYEAENPANVESPGEALRDINTCTIVGQFHVCRITVPLHSLCHSIVAIWNKLGEKGGQFKGFFQRENWVVKNCE